MSKKIFVGGLAWATVDAGLKAAFEPFGTVVDAKVIMDRETGRSRGFGFVTFSSEEEAQSACDAMNGQEIEGRTVRINIADDTQRKPSGNRGGFNRSNREPREGRPNREFREPREPRDNSEQPVTRREEYRREEPSRSYVNDFAYMPDDSSAKRDSRRKDRRKDRDRYQDDDDRW